MAIGCASRDRTVAFASTFAAFFSRAYDQIRMGAISQTNVNLVGSHCGVSIGKLFLYWISIERCRCECLSSTHCILASGEDGPSQMALEDLAMFRAIPTCTVFYPSDAVSTERAVELSSNTKVGGHLVVACPRCLHPVGEQLIYCNALSISRVYVSSVQADQPLQSSTPQRRSLKWA